MCEIYWWANRHMQIYPGGRWSLFQGQPSSRGDERTCYPQVGTKINMRILPLIGGAEFPLLIMMLVLMFYWWIKNQNCKKASKMADFFYFFVYHYICIYWCLCHHRLRPQSQILPNLCCNHVHIKAKLGGVILTWINKKVGKSWLYSKSVMFCFYMYYIFETVER